uniref:Uncharacterized protein n=1 Tax=Strigamia maritima TaxID=126957 RepID=T1JGX3_STRMM
MSNLRSKVGGVRPGHLALFEAIKHARFRQAQLLVEGGADVNGRSEKGEPSLVTSCIQVEDGRSRARFCQLLLQAGADVNARDGNGQTALMHAAILGCQHVVNLLLDHGLTDVNAQDTRGNTALMYAGIFGHEEIVKTMLNPHKQNPNLHFQLNLRNYSGSTAADLARHKGHVRLELALRVYDSKINKFDQQVAKHRPLQQLKLEESQTQPPNRPPTPAHLHLLPNLDLNASVRSEPDMNRDSIHSRRLRLSDSALSRIRSEPHGLDQLPRQVTSDSYEEVVDLTDNSCEIQTITNAMDEVRLPPILPPRTLHLLAGKEGRRKSLKRKKDGRESAHVPLIDAK